VINQELRYSHSNLLTLIMQMADIGVVVSCFLMAHLYYFGHLAVDENYRDALILAVLLVPIIFTSTGCYRSWRGKNFISQIKVVIFSWALIPAALLLLSVILKTTIIYSRIWFGLWAVMTMLVLIVMRRLMVMSLKFMRKNGWNHKKVLVYGAGDLGKFVAKRIKDADWTGYDIVSFFDDKDSLDGQLAEGIVIRGGRLHNLGEYIVNNNIHEVWFALPLREEKRLQELLFELRNFAIAIRYIPDLNGFRFFLNHGITEIAGVTGVELNHSPMADGLNRLVKGVEDRVLAFIFIIIFSPLMIAIAIAIRLETKGPALFKQIRDGWDGLPIRVYKFRTMTYNKVEGDFVQATKNDSRVTRVGAFLRRTSLDELPQLYNVLQGRMSIVGPRPHPVMLNDICKNEIDCYMQRHRVKPGMTGWAQVNGWRGETDTMDKMQKRVDHDLFYIRNWSLWFDFKIIIMTFFRGFLNAKAY
jgi:putative colanic acid biosysnthesis UDP-glucose lipid carrier transferase